MLESSQTFKEIIKLQVFAWTAVILLISHCGNTGSSNKIPNATNYNEFIDYHVNYFCKKSIECNQPLIRTISVEEQKKVTVETCIQTAKEEIQNKLKLHTEEMKLLSVSCYAALRDANCKKMLLVQFTHPACLKLRETSNEAYERAGLTKPPASLLRDYKQ
jgi:hypothetical protein